VSFFVDPEKVGIEENDERARHVLNTCPRMREVEHWDLDPGHVIVLGREGGRVVWTVERVDDVDSRFMHIYITDSDGRI
jgi:pyrrolidone-carboxylate peptidase